MILYNLQKDVDQNHKDAHGMSLQLGGKVREVEGFRQYLSRIANAPREDATAIQSALNIRNEALEKSKAQVQDLNNQLQQTTQERDQSQKEHQGLRDAHVILSADVNKWLYKDRTKTEKELSDTKKSLKTLQQGLSTTNPYGLP